MKYFVLGAHGQRLLVAGVTGSDYGGRSPFGSTIGGSRGCTVSHGVTQRDVRAMGRMRERVCIGVRKSYGR